MKAPQDVSRNFHFCNTCWMLEYVAIVLDPISKLPIKKLKAIQNFFAHSVTNSYNISIMECGISWNSLKLQCFFGIFLSWVISNKFGINHGAYKMYIHSHGCAFCYEEIVAERLILMLDCYFIKGPLTWSGQFKQTQHVDCASMIVSGKLELCTPRKAMKIQIKALSCFPSPQQGQPLHPHAGVRAVAVTSQWTAFSSPSFWLTSEAWILRMHWHSMK